MKQLLMLVLCSAIAGMAQVSGAPLTSSQIQDAIAKGKQFGTRDRYLDTGLKAQKFKLAGAFASDGISKYLIFFTDYDIVAAAAAEATHQMREFSDVDARHLPLSGLTLVNVQLHARGDFPVRRLQRHFMGQDLHLVLQIGDTILQPTTRSDIRDSGVMPADGPVITHYWTHGNTSLITTDTLGFTAERIEVEFAFQIPIALATAKAKVILIDGEGKHYTEEVELARIRHAFDGVAVAEGLKDSQEKFYRSPAQPNDSEAGKKQTEAQSAQAEHATLNISSSPPNADIELDGSFAGNTPSSLGVASGEHTIRISKGGYDVWERKIRSFTGEVRIAADLKANDVPGFGNPSEQTASTSRANQNPSSPASTLPALKDKSEAADAVPSNSISEVNQEDSIGVSLLGKATVRHDGVEVSGVLHGGTAEDLGIRSGGFILAIDDHYVFTVQDLSNELRSHPRGSRVAIRYRRNSLIYDAFINMGSSQR